VYFVLVFPANIYAAIEDVPLNGDPATPLWFRIPEQLLYIATALWAAKDGYAPTGSGGERSSARGRLRVGRWPLKSARR